MKCIGVPGCFASMGGNVSILPSRPDVGALADSEALSRYTLGWVRAFSRRLTFGHSPQPEDMPNYDAAYHEERDYVRGGELEQRIKTLLPVGSRRRTIRRLTSRLRQLWALQPAVDRLGALSLS